MTTMPSKPQSDKSPALTKAEALAAISRAETLLSDLLSSPSLERSAYQRGREALNGLRAAREVLIMETAKKIHALSTPRHGKEYEWRRECLGEFIKPESGPSASVVGKALTLTDPSKAKDFHIGVSYIYPWPGTGVSHKFVVTAIDEENGIVVVDSAPKPPDLKFIDESRSFTTEQLEAISKPAPSTVYCHRCRIEPSGALGYKLGDIHICGGPLQAEHWDAKSKDCRCSTDDSYHLAGCRKLKPKAKCLARHPADWARAESKGGMEWVCKLDSGHAGDHIGVNCYGGAIAFQTGPLSKEGA